MGRKSSLENNNQELGSVAPLERSSLSRRASDIIRQSIVSGALQPGETISPQELSERLKVSRTPVREALILLNAIGLVEFHPGRIQIAATTPDAIREAFELREALEGRAAGLAAERRTETEATLIMDLATKSGEAAANGDRTGFRELDRAFHLAIAKAAHSAHLERYLSYALDLALTLRNLRLSNAPFHPKSVGYHRAIAKAILDKNTEDAESLSRQHVRAVCESVSSSVADLRR